MKNMHFLYKSLDVPFENNICTIKNAHKVLQKARKHYFNEPLGTLEMGMWALVSYLFQKIGWASIKTVPHRPWNPGFEPAIFQL